MNNESENYIVDPLSVAIFRPNNDIYGLGTGRYEDMLMTYLGTDRPKAEYGGVVGRGVAIDKRHSSATGFIAYDHNNRGWWGAAGFNIHIESICKAMRLKREGIVFNPAGRSRRRITNVQI